MQAHLDYDQRVIRSQKESVRNQHDLDSINGITHLELSGRHTNRLDPHTQVVAG